MEQGRLHNLLTIISYTAESMSKTRSTGVKVSKVSVIILLLLIGVMILEVNYFRSKTESGTLKSEVSNQPIPVEENLTKTGEEEDQKILHTVDAYQEGYKDGCPEGASMRKGDPVGGPYERSYILGFEKAKNVCKAKRKQQRDLEREKEQQKKGEEDGCSTAKGKPVQDKPLYLKKEAYYKGWESGYKQCKKRAAKKEAVKKESTIEKRRPPKKATPGIDRRSREYQRAYQDACRAAEGRGFRDEELYLRNRNYRAGWTEGRKACPPQREISERKPVRKNYFDQGYRDGCASAEGYFRKDRYVYARHRSYREGWSLGNQECVRRGRIERLPPPPMPFPPFGF